MQESPNSSENELSFCRVEAQSQDLQEVEIMLQVLMFE